MTFTYDLTAALAGEATLTITHPATGFGDVQVFACYRASSNAADYPARAQGELLTVAPGSSSAVVPLFAHLDQGDVLIRIFNPGTSAATLTRARGRKYS